MYNTKLAEEKKVAQGKKKPQKAQIKGGGAKGYDMANKNNNMAMVADVMGAGDDEDDYADAGVGFKREEENDYDFM